MRKLSKTLLSLLLIAAMLASFVVLPAAAEEPAAEQPTEAVQAAETQADDAEKSNYELSIVMLDCGRKYFSVDSIKQIIDNAAAAGFNNVIACGRQRRHALPAGRYEPDRERHDLFQ